MDSLFEPPVGYDEARPLPMVCSNPLYRVHSAEHDVLYFNRTKDYRFNAPNGGYGVLYASLSVEGSLAETLVHSRTRPPSVRESVLCSKALVRLVPSRDLQLADLSGTGLARLGLDARIASGDCYDLARRWSEWIFRDPRRWDGIVYRARNAPGSLSVALFEGREVQWVPEVMEALLCTGPGELPGCVVEFIDRFQVALVP